MEDLRLEFFRKLNRSGPPVNAPVIEYDRQHALYLQRCKLKTTTMRSSFLSSSPQNTTKQLTASLPTMVPSRPEALRLYSCHWRHLWLSWNTWGTYRLGGKAPCDLPSSSVDANVVRQDLSMTLKLLHPNDLVFCDTREQNVLYLAKRHALLVDFDGIGLDRVNRYFICLNPQVAKVLNVDRMQIMDKLHDLENLNRLVGRLLYWVV